MLSIPVSDQRFCQVQSTRLLPLTNTNDISRFSNIERPRMHRFLNSAGPVGDSLDNAEHRIALPFGPIGRNKSQSAKLLGIGLNTLRRKLRSYGIE